MGKQFVKAPMRSVRHLSIRELEQDVRRLEGRLETETNEGRRDSTVKAINRRRARLAELRRRL